MCPIDSPEDIQSLDPENMYNRIFDFPEQMEDALKIASGWRFDTNAFVGFRNIVVVGMGGSAIGGELARAALQDKLEIPFEVVRHYRLPEYVDDETLVIASSYSGNTEETLSAVSDAIDRKAELVALTTGGMLEEICRLNEIPHLILPRGLQPRAALGYSFVPLMTFFEKIGLAPGATGELTATVTKLQGNRDSYIESQHTDMNQSKQLARAMWEKAVIIYGGPGFTGAIAQRWKGQINENAKNLAFANVYPEMNHNELVAWCEQVDIHRDHLVVVQLRDTEDHSKVTQRMDIVREIIEKQQVAVLEVESSGASRIERMFSLIQLGDWVSYYLAILNGVDPTPVDAIETLKGKLASSQPQTA